LKRFEELEKENAKLNNEYNEQNFSMIQKTLEFNEAERMLCESNSEIQRLLGEIIMIDSNVSELNTQQSELDLRIQENSHSLEKVNQKNEGLEQEINALSSEIEKYQGSIPKLLKDCEELNKKVASMQNDQGKPYSEKFEEILRYKSEDLCVVCLLPESGRMKKCIICSALVHSKCSKDLRFVCSKCKTL